MVRFWIGLFGLVVVVSAAVAKPLPDKGEPFSAKRFERWANELPFFCAEDFFTYGRIDSVFFRLQMPPTMARQYHELLTRATAAQTPANELVPLLQHPNAKVRMLAVAALFQQNEPKYLPLFMGLLGDGATGLPAPVFSLRANIVEPPKEPPPFKPQTVGRVASLALQTYLEAAGAISAEAPAPLQDIFAAYWTERKDRANCASWCLVRVVRATQGTSAISKRGIAELKKIRADIDRLPVFERAWTLLWIGSRRGEFYAPYFATTEELVKAGKVLGPKALLAMLEGANPSGDPDLAVKPKYADGRRSMPYFVLEHAEELLEPSMADRLLELKTAANSGTPYWDIAAARLAPERSAAILETALARLTYQYGGHERAQLAVELWRSKGLNKTAALLDWFYTERITSAFGYGNSRGYFVREVGKSAGADSKRLLAKLIEDPRFDKCDWQSTLALNDQVGRWTKKPVISEEEVRNNNPAAGANFELNLGRAREMYPNETERSLRLLAEWRDRLRSSIRQWATK
jgi:hypothetical protein